MQCIARNITLNVRQQIFVRGDSKSGRSVLPLNFESAASVQIGESSDWSFLSFDLTIASDARQMTSSDQNDTPSKQYKRDLSHVTRLPSYDARSWCLRFNKIEANRLSRRPAELSYWMIFIFTASTRTPST